MSRRRRKMVGRMGLVLLSAIAAVIGVCIGGAIVMGILQTYGSI